MDDLSSIVQGTDEWFAARLGRVTASRVADVIAKTKSGPSASRANYMAELVAERLTKTPADKFTNAAMQWGTDQEPAARNLYEFMKDVEVIQVGFVAHPSIEMSGASPDGLIAADGLVEIKCPNTATHIDTLVNGDVAGKYITQIQWQLACTGREWCDFVSFDPRLPASMQLFVRRVARDDARISELERDVRAFLSELDRTVATLIEKYERAI